MLIQFNHHKRTFLVPLIDDSGTEMMSLPQQYQVLGWRNCVQLRYRRHHASLAHVSEETLQLLVCHEHADVPGAQADEGRDEPGKLGWKLELAPFCFILICEKELKFRTIVKFILKRVINFRIKYFF